MEKIWKIKKLGNEEDIIHLAKVLNIDESLANLLVQRGIKDFDAARFFFRPKLTDLHDPFLMQDMQQAVERLETAMSKGEKILVYGDYDVDGTTSVALMYSFLKEIYQNLDFYIPDRYEEGYGISRQGIDHAAAGQFSLVIALDCGIKAIDKIAYASQHNIDFIICDHHTPGDTIPQAVAVLDPKRSDCNYPFKELSGCGVGFKFIQAYSIYKELNMSKVYDYLDLVAVSIASDIVPIVGENRTLAHFGLKKLNENPRVGLKALIDLASIAETDIKISDVVFKIGPRINAAGRIDKAKKAVGLLIAHDKQDALEIGDRIDKYNVTRQELDQNITQAALQMIEDDPDCINKKSTVLYKADWHKGVIGIVASRLIEVYYKPTIVLTKSNGKATGSARSVHGFNLYEAIDACSDLLENFGGHMYAAGLTLKIENIDAFKARFEEVVSRLITEDQLLPIIEIDAKLDFRSINAKFYRILKQFAPFGPENMSPVFSTEHVYDIGGTRIVGKTGEHLKLDMIDQYTVIQGIGFGLAQHYEHIKAGQAFDVCYAIDENNFRGNTTLQLMVKDIKIREEES